MDPSLGSFMNNVRHQVVNRKIGSFEAIGKGNPVVPMDVIPASAPVAPQLFGRGVDRPRQLKWVERQGHLPLDNPPR